MYFNSTPLTLVDKETVPLVYDGLNGQGTPGSAGKSMRGISTWRDTGYGSTGGYEGKDDTTGEYYDIVIDPVNKKYYQCKYSVNPDSGVAATDARPGLNLVTDDGCWELMNNFENIATKALAADEALIRDLKSQMISVEQLHTYDKKVNITGGLITVSDSDDVIRAQIHNGPLTTAQSGSSAAVGNTITGQGGDTQVDVNILGNASVTILGANNKVTIPSITLTASASVHPDATPAEWQVYPYAENISTGEWVELSPTMYFNGAALNATIPSIKITLPDGSWNIIYRVGVDVIAEEQTISVTIPSYGNVSVVYQVSGASTEMAKDGFRSIWSGEGIEVTAAGAKVLQGGVTKNILGSTTGKGFEFVGPNDSYPADSDMVEGVLYIKFGS